VEEKNYSFIHFSPFHQIALNGQYHAWVLNRRPVKLQVRSERFGVKISLVPLPVTKQQLLGHLAYCIVTTMTTLSQLPVMKKKNNKF